MSEIMEVRAVTALLLPMFREMLHDDEYRSLRLSIREGWGRDERQLWDDDLVEHNSAFVHWWVLGERGSSGGLHMTEGSEALVRSVQSDLQDWISETHFGWGQHRGPFGLT